MNKATVYVSDLSDSLQARIRRSLTSALCYDYKGEELREEVQRAMDSKLSDLENTINVQRLLK